MPVYRHDGGGFFNHPFYHTMSTGLSRMIEIAAICGTAQCIKPTMGRGPFSTLFAIQLAGSRLGRGCTCLFNVRGMVSSRRLSVQRVRLCTDDSDRSRPDVSTKTR